MHCVRNAHITPKAMLAGSWTSTRNIMRQIIKSLIIMLKNQRDANLHSRTKGSKMPGMHVRNAERTDDNCSFKTLKNCKSERVDQHVENKKSKSKGP